MHYAIIAAGEGSRLSEYGPKPLENLTDVAVARNFILNELNRCQE